VPMHCGYAAIPYSFILLGWWIVAGLPEGSTSNDCADCADCADLLGAAANRLVELNLKGYLCVAELARALTLGTNSLLLKGKAAYYDCKCRDKNYELLGETWHPSLPKLKR